MAPSASGKFITFEGAEGAGKSTQCQLLAEALGQAGITVVQTREPGGSAGAEQIRGLLVDGSVNRWDALTETLLLLAARRDHIVRVIRPALDQGQWVICDRFSDSTLAYQGYGHGIDLALIRDLSRNVQEALVPDLTLIFDIPVDDGLARAAQRNGGEDRYERMSRDFHERLRNGFLDIALGDPGRCAIVDGRRDIADILRDVRKIVADRFPESFQ